MNTKQIRATLRKAFLALNDKELGNLLYHVGKGTHICCGDEWVLYTDGEGGG